MEGYKTYRGRKRRRSRARSGPYTQRGEEIARRQAVKLAICFALFVVGVLLKLVFPQILQAVGDKISETVNYKAALATLGEGISGEKKFTEALSEAFTYAFSTKEAPDENVAPVDNEEGAVPAFADSAGAAESPAKANEDGEGDAEREGKGAAEGKAEPVGNKELSDAIISAFLQSQEAFSDYAIPAGVTFEMPRLPFEVQKPVEGTVSSSFGFRRDPEDGVTVRFHYGTDIAAEEGAVVRAFADGKVIAVGENASMGRFVVVSHGAVESTYGHLSSVTVSEGQAVTRGQRVGAVGSTGNATNPCLHFELKVSGQNVNPEYYIDWS